MKIEWVHFPLHPNTPAEGRRLSDMFAGRGIDLNAMHQRMSEEMAAENLPYSKRTHTYNSRLAQELGKWGDTTDHGDALHDALYRAYFVDGRDISNIDELVAIAVATGLDAGTARSVLVERRFSAAIDADWEKSQDYGVTGVPTFAVLGMGVPGAQPYEVLQRMVEKATKVRDRKRADQAT